MIPVQIRFTKRIIEHLDKLIECGVYSNRSEAIRDATRRLVLDLNRRETQGLIGIEDGKPKSPEDLKRDMNAR